MAIVRFEIDPQQPALAAGVPIPRGTSLKSNLGKGERTPCMFQTAHDVKLLPLRVVEARYFTRDVQELNLAPELGARAALRIRLQTTGGQTFDKISVDDLTFYVRGADDLPSAICEQLFARKLGLVLQSVADRGKELARLPSSRVQRVGFSPEEALLRQAHAVLRAIGSFANTLRCRNVTCFSSWPDWLMPRRDTRAINSI